MSNHAKRMKPSLPPIPTVVLTVVSILTSLLPAGCKKEAEHVNPLVKEVFLSPHLPSFYYWNRILSIPQEDVDLLGKGGPLFIKVCELDVSYEGEVRLHDFIQKGAGTFPNGSAVIGVYRGNYSLAVNLRKLNPERLASQIIDSFHWWRDNFQAIGLKMVGLQLDIDVPTEQLKHYRNLLKLLRDRLPPNYLSSITALPTWVDHEGFRRVAETVDFFVPQFYTNLVRKQINRGPFIFTELALEKELGKVDRFGVPYLVGLPTFGAVFHYNPKGELINLVYHNLSVEDLTTNRYLRFEEQWDATTEEIMLFRCLGYTRENQLTMRPGDEIVIARQKAEGLLKIRRRIRKLPLKNFMGIAWYRMKEKGESLPLPVEEIVEIENRAKEGDLP